MDELYNKIRQAILEDREQIDEVSQERAMKVWKYSKNPKSKERAYKKASGHPDVIPATQNEDSVNESELGDVLGSEEGVHKTPKTHKDEYGNVIKNYPKHMAKKAMKDITKEEVELQQAAIAIAMKKAGKKPISEETKWIKDKYGSGYTSSDGKRAIVKHPKGWISRSTTDKHDYSDVYPTQREAKAGKYAWAMEESVNEETNFSQSAVSIYPNGQGSDVGSHVPTSKPTKIPTSSAVGNEQHKDRSFFNSPEKKDYIGGMVKNIKSGKTLPPVMSTPHPADPSKNIVVDGNHRAFAHQEAGASHIPAVHVSHDNIHIASHDYEHPDQSFHPLSSFKSKDGSYDMNKPRPQLGGKPLKHYFAGKKPIKEEVEQVDEDKNLHWMDNEDKGSEAKKRTPVEHKARYKKLVKDAEQFEKHSAIHSYAKNRAQAYKNYHNVNEEVELDEEKKKVVITLSPENAKKITHTVRDGLGRPLDKDGNVMKESHTVKYAMKNPSMGGKIAVAHYDSKEDAEKFLQSIKKKGGNGIISTVKESVLDEARGRPPEVELSESKNSHEYDYEGDMALNQLAQMMHHIGELKSMLKPETNLPEWVQLKITLAADYIQTASDYLSGEMKEEAELKRGRGRRPKEGSAAFLRQQAAGGKTEYAPGLEAQLLRHKDQGELGSHEIQFNDGSTHKISGAHREKGLNIIRSHRGAGTDPDYRDAALKHMSGSHENFNKWIHGTVKRVEPKEWEMNKSPRFH